MSADEKTCRCPPRPGFAAGSMAGGSATEDRLVQEWMDTHGHHRYAKGRHAVAVAMGAYGLSVDDLHRIAVEMEQP